MPTHMGEYRYSLVEDEEERLCHLPLSTVIVKWQLKLSFPPFSLSELSYVLSGYGKVKSVKRLEANSAVVVFTDLLAAQRAVSSKTLGDPICRMSCHWFYPMLAHPSIFAALKHQPQSKAGS